MTEQKTNSKQLPKVYYAKHLFPGVCKYDNEMILIDVATMKKMCASFEGKPVFVGHDDDVAKFMSGASEDMPEEVDGYVSDCFYNEQDGWLWSKIIVTSDRGHQAIADGWSVSNAYMVVEDSAGGQHHNVDYDRKIVNAEFTHLAIVPDPRYEQAQILTPEAYKRYGQELQNSKGVSKMKFKLFRNKKEEVNDVDENTYVELKNGKSVSVAEMVNAVEAAEKEKDEKLNMDTEIEVGNEKMPLSELINRYTELSEKENSSDDDEYENEEDEDEKENMDDAGNDHELDNMDEEEKEKQNAKRKNFDELKNAHKRSETVRIVDTGMDQLERGKQRYGK